MKQTRLSSSLTSWNVHSLQIAKRKKKTTEKLFTVDYTYESNRL